MQLLTPPSMSRGEDLCFGYEVCDSLFITSSSSTFSWWMGYLMESKGGEGLVFFNDDMDKFSPYTREGFPPEWIPLRDNLTNAAIQVYNKKMSAIKSGGH